jgi:hypothetical protein
VFISYDLQQPGQDHAIIVDEIKSLIDWTNVHRSLIVVYIAIGLGKHSIFCGVLALTCCKVWLPSAKNIPNVGDLSNDETNNNI